MRNTTTNTMKKFIFASLLAFAACFDAAAQEYKVVTVVESILPLGQGRSRIIEATSQVDSDAATTERIDGTAKRVKQFGSLLRIIMRQDD